MERFLMNPDAKLNELPSLLTNMHKEKLMQTGASSDKMDVACKKVITDEKLNELWKEVDEQCKKISSNLPKTNAYFKRMLFQEMHMCIILRALKSKSIVHTTIGPGGGKTIVQHMLIHYF